MFNLKEWYVTRKRRRVEEEKERLDTLALARVLLDPEMVNKVAGVYLNGLQPLSVKDRFISGKTINLNCTAFYGGTFEGCTFISEGRDDALLRGSHLIVTGSQFYGTKFTSGDMETVSELVNTRLTQLKRQIAFHTLQVEKGLTEETREEARYLLDGLHKSVEDVKRVKSSIENEQTAVKFTEGGL